MDCPILQLGDEKIEKQFKSQVDFEKNIFPNLIVCSSNLKFLYCSFEKMLEKALVTPPRKLGEQYNSCKLLKFRELCLGSTVTNLSRSFPSNYAKQGKQGQPSLREQ